jgi:predicted enzyme related to lactoylglutathione lyase
MPNHLCHFEFLCKNPGKLKAFYSRVFEWTFRASGMEGYTLIDAGQQPGGGMIEKSAEAPASSLNVYFLVDSVDATLARAQRAGGKILVPKTPIGDVGAFGLFSDPEGIVVGIYEAGRG